MVRAPGRHVSAIARTVPVNVPLLLLYVSPLPPLLALDLAVVASELQNDLRLPCKNGTAITTGDGEQRVAHHWLTNGWGETGG